MTINGTDIKEFGAFLLDGSYTGMLTWPSLRNVVMNDWWEEDGVDVDMTEATLSGRTLTVLIGISGEGKRERFTSWLMGQGRRHTVTESAIGLNSELRLAGVTALGTAGMDTLTKLALVYHDDKLGGFLNSDGEIEPYSPTSSLGLSDDYSINGKNLGVFGIRTLGGADSFRKPALVKDGLVRDVATANGRIADVKGDAEHPLGLTRYGAKNVTLTCLMRGRSVSEFVNNWHALIYECSQKGVRAASTELYSSLTGETYGAVYAGGQFSKIYSDADGVWAIMSVSFTLVSVN